MSRLASIAAVAGTTAAVVAFAAAPASADATSVTAIAPAAATAATAVVITGTGLSAVSAVAFPGAADVATTPVSDTEIDVTVPNAAHSGSVVLRTPSGDVTAPPFTVIPTATTTASPHSVVYPATVSVTGALTSGGIGLPGQPATLQSRTAGFATWVNGPTATTDSAGQVRFTARPLSTMAYRIAYGATSSYAAVTSNDVTVVQHPLVSRTLPSLAPILTTMHVTGSVKPAQTGAIQLQRYYSGAWHTVARGLLSSTGHFSLPMKLGTKGTFTFRVRRPSNTHQAGNVSTSGKVVGVDRTLRSGMHGADVTTLQNRLKALHYDVGSVSGTFGFDTAHAVVAFEKVQGLHRDGVVGRNVWKALAAPRVPHLRHPLRGAAAIEVDLTRQVLYYAVNGSIRRILDASTGGGYYYVGSDGTTQRAITPTGHFSIKYKVNRWVTAKLGVLYRPAYFNYSGYAIHGEPEVPSYPASHGCVRITVPAMDRIYSRLTDGMSVWIYRS